VMLEQLERFFITYNEVEGRTFTLLGVENAAAALKLIKTGRNRARRKG